MNTTLKAAIAAALIGTATLAVAQTPGDSLADRIRQFQALSAAGPAFKPQPTFSDEPRVAAPRLSFREYQAMSSDSPEWQLDDVRTATSNETTIARKNRDERNVGSKSEPGVAPASAQARHAGTVQSRSN